MRRKGRKGIEGEEREAANISQWEEEAALREGLENGVEGEEKNKSGRWEGREEKEYKGKIDGQSRPRS